MKVLGFIIALTVPVIVMSCNDRKESLDLLTAIDKEKIDALEGPILVIGASGFIGKKLVERLLKSNISVRAISRNIENLSELKHNNLA